MALWGVGGGRRAARRRARRAAAKPARSASPSSLSTCLRSGQTRISRPHAARSTPRPRRGSSRRAVRGLAEDRDRLMTRLAAVEHNMDDVTGSITRQIEAVKAAAEAPVAPWPSEPPCRATPDERRVGGRTGRAAGRRTGIPAPAGLRRRPPREQSARRRRSIGDAIRHTASISAARSRSRRCARAGPRSDRRTRNCFEGLQPVVTVKDNPRSNRLELRLVVGPLPMPKRRRELCASLAAFRVSCQPTMFDGQHLALQ